LLLAIVLAGAAVAASGQEAVTMPRPLHATPATTQRSFTMDAFVRYFDGLRLQEAREVEGWTAGLEFAFPFRRGMQLRFLLPARTEADGTLVETGGDIEIEGWGGTFDFATLTFEHQLVGLEGGPNRFAWFVGAGHRTAVLETDTPDRYNHRGRSLHLGVRYDRLTNTGSVWYLDTEVRLYEESDDLHPGSLSDDSFWFGEVTAAWMGRPRGVLRPGLELATQVTQSFFAASLVPELILGGSGALALNFGLPVGVTSDAPDWGAQLRLSVSL
jgi:hypothetical protein